MALFLFVQDKQNTGHSLRISIHECMYVILFPNLGNLRLFQRIDNQTIILKRRTEKVPMNDQYETEIKNFLPSTFSKERARTKSLDHPRSFMILNDK